VNALLRLVGWVLALALVALPVVAVLNGWIGANQWPLKRLRVTGEFERVDAAALRKTLLPYAQRGFFAVDLPKAQDAVSKLPWVERAEVRKRWPDVLEVTVIEHKPFARWGQDRLLSEQGRLFPIGKDLQIPDKLPQFGGPDGRVADVVALYNESRELFAPVGLEVRDLEVDQRGSWTMGLSNGARIVIGRTEQRSRLSRFVHMLPQLTAQKAQVLERADLRYTNGFSLTWAPAQQAPAAAPKQQGQS